MILAVTTWPVTACLIAVLLVLGVIYWRGSPARSGPACPNCRRGVMRMYASSGHDLDYPRRFWFCPTCGKIIDAE